jgi:hypothetical protein
MNEPNNLVYAFFSRPAAAIALTEGASIIRSANPEAKIAINVSMEYWGWKGFLTELLQRSGRAVDIVGLDHYPGTWTIGMQAKWAEITQLSDIIASAGMDSPWFNRHLMVMETGFSTNALMRNEDRQSEYFDHLMRSAIFLKGKSAADAPVFGIYELCDGDSSACLDPEAHFGLLTSDLLPKKAFASVKACIALDSAANLKGTTHAIE